MGRVKLLVPLLPLAFITIFFLHVSFNRYKETNLLSDLSEVIEVKQVKTFEVKSDLETDAITLLSTKNTSQVTIYFIETSDVVKPRSLCSVEAAARHNPQADIILLVTSASLQTDELDILRKRFNNFRTVRLNVSRLFEDTEFKDFYYSGKLKSSKFEIVHTSDIVRSLIIWKYGGIYLDTDIITLKPLTNLTNFVVFALDDVTVTNSVFGFSKKSNIIHKLLLRQITEFDGQNWAVNGPIAFTDAIQKICGTKKFRNCKNFQILPRNSFNTIAYFQANGEFFNKNKLQHWKKRWSESYGIHFFNHMTTDHKIMIESPEPLSWAAKHNCPLIYYSQEEYL
jgi:aspartate 1-decarboxylase